MRAVVQRVARAQVTVEGEIKGAIERGLVVLLGVAADDTDADLRYLIEKVCGLRIFADEAGRLNRSVVDVAGSVLAVSQFTLYGDARHGKRPSFTQAAEISLANAYYEKFLAGVRAHNISVASGVFRAHMQVELVNDGPVTILLDSAKQF